MLKIGLIGCGTIGSEIARAITDRFSQEAELVALCEIDEQKAKKFLDTLVKKPELLSMDELIQKSELVVEAAGGEVVELQKEATPTEPVAKEAKAVEEKPVSEKPEETKE